MTLDGFVKLSFTCASEGLEDLDRILGGLVVDSLFTLSVTASRHRYFPLDIVPI
jgi:hypothetical protein